MRPTSRASPMGASVATSARCCSIALRGSSIHCRHRVAPSIGTSRSISRLCSDIVAPVAALSQRGRLLRIQREEAMTRLLFAATLAAIVSGVSHADAQTYPARPITMIVPLAPGGSTDVIGRIMAEGMRPSLGQPIIVENVTGAGGTIGVGRLARSTPDGYTFGIGQWGTNMANGAIYSLQYDLVTDFEPIALIATQPFLIVT